MERITLTYNLFRHFIKFLKVNGFYSDYVYNFFVNYGVKFDDATNLSENYNQIMLKRTRSQLFEHYHTEFKSMFFTFASFRWAGTDSCGGRIDENFTKKWCSINIKWALYCLENEFEICSEERFARLLRYYKDNKWLSEEILTQEELKKINKICVGKNTSLNKSPLLMN